MHLSSLAPHKKTWNQTHHCLLKIKGGIFQKMCFWFFFVFMLRIKIECEVIILIYALNTTLKACTTLKLQKYPTASTVVTIVDATVAMVHCVALFCVLNCKIRLCRWAYTWFSFNKYTTSFFYQSITFATFQHSYSTSFWHLKTAVNAQQSRRAHAQCHTSRQPRGQHGEKR